MESTTNALFKGTVPLGSIRGIPIRLSVSFLGLLAIIVITAAVLNNVSLGVLYLVLMGPVLLLTVLVHELGHCLAARQVGGAAYGILLWPLGGLAYVGHDTGPRADIWVAVAGPLTHIPMVLLWVVIYVPVFYARFHTTHITLDAQVSSWDNLGVNLCISAILMNLALMAFNLLVPAYPLDGGRILADLLLVCGVPETLAAKIVIGVAIPISLAIIALGIVFLSSASSFMTILVGVWILFSTLKLLQILVRGQIKQHPLFAFNPNQIDPPHAAQNRASTYAPNDNNNAQQLVCTLFMLGHPDLEYVFPGALEKKLT